MSPLIERLLNRARSKEPHVPMPISTPSVKSTLEYSKQITERIQEYIEAKTPPAEMCVLRVKTAKNGYPTSFDLSEAFAEVEKLHRCVRRVVVPKGLPFNLPVAEKGGIWGASFEIDSGQDSSVRLYFDR